MGGGVHAEGLLIRAEVFKPQTSNLNYCKLVASNRQNSHLRIFRVSLAAVHKSQTILSTVAETVLKTWI